MRSRIVLIAGCLGFISNTLPGQKDSLTQASNSVTFSRSWIVPTAVGISVAFDEEAREGALASHSRALDRLARVVNPLGTARILVPAMVISFVGGAVARDSAFERGALNTAAAYVASDLVESVLKPVIGRERPHVSGNSRRFHAFTRSGDWHSFPSAHVSHITSIVEGISEQTHSTRISAVGDLLVSLVDWDRVYEDQHWVSDVTASVAISSFVSRATVRWMEAHWRRPDARESGT